MIKIFFEREGRYVEVPPGETLLHAAQKAGVELHRHVESAHHCFGDEACTTCGVEVKSGAGALSARTSLEHEVPNTLRLACQARAYTDTVVSTLDDVRFIADTAAPTWGLFSGKGAGLTTTGVRGVAMA